ncbi:hypothetical protein [Streptomyces sp. NPDC047525]|uniref:AMP-binding enzyme n=1 Tax=Streptomyces sp. NPDC047525 TaxID=3155264 RepID=UPI0033CB6199
MAEVARHLRQSVESAETDDVSPSAATAPELVESALLQHPSVTAAAAVVVPHSALGTTIGALVVLDGHASVDAVTEHARQLLPEELVVRPVARVAELPTTHDGRFNSRRAEAMLIDVSELPLDGPPPSRRRATGIAREWEDLVLIAEDEQVLLAGALRTLHTKPELEGLINQALGYPDWPMPLTLLPDVAPDLATADPDLESYFEMSQAATEHVLEAVNRHGWPRARRDGAHVADAAWLLLQHADRENQAREDALAAVTQDVARGHCDPRHLALLKDRTRTVMEEEQIFGTLMLAAGGQPRFLYPTQALEQVEHQRRIIAMPSLSEDLPNATVPLLPYGPSRRATGPTSRHTPRTPNITELAPRTYLPCPVPHGVVPVYLAGSVQDQSDLRALRERMSAPLHCTARWLDLVAAKRCVSQFDAGPAADCVAFQLRTEDILRSRLVIAAQGDAQMEIGIALGAEIPVVLIGVSGDPLDAHPAIARAADADCALDAAMDWAAQ